MGMVSVFGMWTGDRLPPPKRVACAMTLLVTFEHTATATSET